MVDRIDLNTEAALDDLERAKKEFKKTYEE